MLALRPAASFLAHQVEVLFFLIVCMCMQGSHWSRKNRMFVMHDSRPQLLSTLVAPSDIMAFSGGDPSSRYVLYSDTQKAAWVTDLREGIKITLKRAESDLVTVVPLHEVKGLSVAPIGTPLCRVLLLHHKSTARLPPLPGCTQLARSVESAISTPTECSGAMSAISVA